MGVLRWKGSNSKSKKYPRCQCVHAFALIYHLQTLLQNACDSNTIQKRERGPEEEFFLLLPVWMKENNTLLPKNRSHRIIWFSVKSPKKALRPLGFIFQSRFIVPDTLAAAAARRGDLHWVKDSDRCTLNAGSLKYCYFILYLLHLFMHMRPSWDGSWYSQPQFLHHNVPNPFNSFVYTLSVAAHQIRLAATK